MKKVILLLIILFVFAPNVVNANDISISANEVLQSQQDTLDIDSFIEEADKYTKDVYADIDMGELFSSAITGNIDNETIFKSILNAMRWRSARCYYSFREYFSNYNNT